MKKVGIKINWVLTIIAITAIFIIFVLIQQNYGLISQNVAGLSVALKPQNNLSPLDKVKLEIFSKEFHETDSILSNNQSQIVFYLKFTNQTNKDIKNAKGLLAIYDASYNKLLTIQADCNQVIPSGQSRVQQINHAYSQLLNTDVELKNTDSKDLRFSWEISNITYQDGSQETF